MSAREGNARCAADSIVALDPMANGFAAALQALGLSPVTLPQDGRRLDPLKFGPCGDALVESASLILGRVGYGTGTGGRR